MTVEDGFVPTPPSVADFTAKTLFVEELKEDDWILFPGAGTGCLAAAVKRYCSVRGLPCPDAVAIDTSSERLDRLEEHVACDEPEVPPISRRSEGRLQPTYPRTVPSKDRPVTMEVETIVDNFLLDPPEGEFDYIVANPPYTRYLAIDEEKRRKYADRFQTAEGQFHLYQPFVEQMQHLLADGGHLTFIAPWRYLTMSGSQSGAAEFRRQLRRDRLTEFVILPEQAFPGVKTQTVVTSLTTTAEPGLEGHFWADRLSHWPSVVREFLRDVGVTDEQRQDEAIEEYYDKYDWVRDFLRRAPRTWGAEAGYRPPSGEESGETDSIQGQLAQWSG